MPERFRVVCTMQGAIKCSDLPLPYLLFLTTTTTAAAAAAAVIMTESESVVDIYHHCHTETVL